MWSFALKGRNVWAVLDEDKGVVSTHATRDEAVAAAHTEVETWEREHPLDVNEGCRVLRNLWSPDGTIEPIGRA